MSAKLDEKDQAILQLIQENSKLTANQIAKKINSPITTVFAKTKRMEELGIIKQYRAILSPEKLSLNTAAFILASVSYTTKTDGTLISQREVLCCRAKRAHTPAAPDPRCRNDTFSQSGRPDRF